MTDQSASPVRWPFCSRRRPCTARMLAPASSTVAMQGVDEAVDQVRVLLQEGAVAALARDPLRAAQVQVDGVTNCTNSGRSKAGLPSSQGVGVGACDAETGEVEDKEGEGEAEEEEFVSVTPPQGSRVG
ncbi:hypothetical protein VTK73DRAFT_4428 [Phialemonium thermophilum]|uniref:Uncharacterized protein n=1 Tax=Phialemonium thermophilum TaxID=223376 RepID=A0ABR3V9H0_9PEZI